MVINTTNELKAYFKKYELSINDICKITGLTNPTVIKKTKELTWNIVELNKIINYTKEPILLTCEV